MLFNSAPFVCFFLVVLVVYRLLPARRRNAWLLCASLVFYVAWIPAYLLLLLVDIVVNYALLRAMQRSARPGVLLAVSVCFTIGLLAFFKYALFVAELLAPAGILVGWSVPLPDVILPLGISFYSFQIVALTVDSYRGELEPPRSLARYTLFVAFFPQLIAGPILRGREFLPQLARGGVLSMERTRRGLWLIASGVVKKVVLGDFLLAPFVDQVYGAVEFAGAPAQLVATYAFAFQIYFDFSGYTDMARGMACLLGFEIPVNFMEPYLSRNPAEFWRRWHTTLSRWLRDYLYIPFGGNRGGAARTSANLMLTMLLGGLWHGAGWNFVIWGGMHGVLLMLHRPFRRRQRALDAPFRPLDALRVFALFHAVCALWVFFRVPDLERALGVFGRLLTGSYLEPWPIVPTALVILCFALHVLERRARLHAGRLRARLGSGFWSGAVEGAALGVIFAVAVAASGVGGEFIYFQF